MGTWKLGTALPLGRNFSGFLQLLQLTQQMLFHLSSERMMTRELSSRKEVMDALLFYLAKNSVPFKAAENEAMKALIHIKKKKKNSNTPAKAEIHRLWPKGRVVTEAGGLLLRECQSVFVLFKNTFMKPFRYSSLSVLLKSFQYG